VGDRCKALKLRGRGDCAGRRSEGPGHICGLTLEIGRGDFEEAERYVIEVLRPHFVPPPPIAPVFSDLTAKDVGFNQSELKLCKPDPGITPQTTALEVFGDHWPNEKKMKRKSSPIPQKPLEGKQTSFLEESSRGTRASNSGHTQALRWGQKYK
jgi:hypothetical protein